MALPSTGQLSLSQIAAEFGGTTPHALSEYYAGGAYVQPSASGTVGTVPSSGQIGINIFHGTVKYNAQWTGNSIYYLDWGIYTSGSNFYFRANGGNGTTLSANTNGSFTTGSSIGANTSDLNGIGYTGSVFTAYINGGLQPVQNMTFSIANKFTGSSGNSPFSHGFQTSGGNMQCRNGGRTGGFITLN